MVPSFTQRLKLVWLAPTNNKLKNLILQNEVLLTPHIFNMANSNYYSFNEITKKELLFFSNHSSFSTASVLNAGTAKCT